MEVGIVTVAAGRLGDIITTLRLKKSFAWMLRDVVFEVSGVPLLGRCLFGEHSKEGFHEARHRIADQLRLVRDQSDTDFRG